MLFTVYQMIFLILILTKRFTLLIILGLYRLNYLCLYTCINIGRFIRTNVFFNKISPTFYNLQTLGVYTHMCTYTLVCAWEVILRRTDIISVFQKTYVHGYKIYFIHFTTLKEDRIFLTIHKKGTTV